MKWRKIFSKPQGVAMQNQSNFEDSLHSFENCTNIYVLVSNYSSVYEIKLGTVDQNEADSEWRLRPYMNTAKKRKALSS